MQARTIAFVATVVLIPLVTLLWLATGLYHVDESEQVIELVFDEPVTDSDDNVIFQGAGYHWIYPWPIGGIEKIDISAINELTLSGDALTGDKKIVSIDTKIQWRVSDPVAWFYEIERTVPTINAVAESVLREIIGKNDFQPITTTDRGRVQAETLEKMQAELDSYNAGVNIASVLITRAENPSEVIGSFRDVQNARQEKETKQNDAQAKANRLIEDAKGYEAQVINDAQAYKVEQINIATGERDRFQALRTEVAKNRKLSEDRIIQEWLVEYVPFINLILIASGVSDSTDPVLHLNRQATTTANN